MIKNITQEHLYMDIQEVNEINEQKNMLVSHKL